jgi:hypothetical protein
VFARRKISEAIERASKILFAAPPRLYESFTDCVLATGKTAAPHDAKSVQSDDRGGGADSGRTFQFRRILRKYRQMAGKTAPDEDWAESAIPGRDRDCGKCRACMR